MLSTERLIPLRAGLSAFVLAIFLLVSLALAQEYSGAERLRINDIVRVGQGVLLPLDGALDPSDPADVPLPPDEALAEESESELAAEQIEPEIDETEMTDAPPDETVANSEAAGEEAEIIETATSDENAVEAEEMAATDETAGIDEASDEDHVIDDLTDAAPVSGELVVEDLTEGEAAADDLATVAPVADEPDIAEPSEDEVVIEDLAALDPVADEPDVGEPVGDETVIDEPDIGEPVEDETTIEELAAVAPADEQSGIDEPEEPAGAPDSPRSAELGNPESIGPYRLWLASYKTVRQAKDGWRDLASTNQELLADLTPIIVLKDLGSDEGTFFRLQAGPLQTQASANTRCSDLIQRDIYCSVLGP